MDADVANALFELYLAKNDETLTQHAFQSALSISLNEHRWIQMPTNADVTVNLFGEGKINTHFFTPTGGAFRSSHNVEVDTRPNTTSMCNQEEGYICADLDIDFDLLAIADIFKIDFDMTFFTPGNPRTVDDRWNLKQIFTLESCFGAALATMEDRVAIVLDNALNTNFFFRNYSKVCRFFG